MRRILSQRGGTADALKRKRTLVEKSKPEENADISRSLIDPEHAPRILDPISEKKEERDMTIPITEQVSRLECYDEEGKPSMISEILAEKKTGIQSSRNEHSRSLLGNTSGLRGSKVH